MIKRSCYLLLFASIVAAAACRGNNVPDTPLVITRLQSPATSEASAEPKLTNSSRGTILSWIDNAEIDPALKFAEHTAAGWSEARTVMQGEHLVGNWADVPSVVRLADNTLAAHWLEGPDSESEAYE